MTKFSNISLETFVPNLVFLTRQNSAGAIWDFRISGESLRNGDFHNSRTSDDIDMKLEPVTKLENRNKTTSKKKGDDVIWENCDTIAIFPIYGQFGAIRKPNSGGIVCETYVFTNSNLFILEKMKAKLKNLQHSSHPITLSKGTILAKKCWVFCKQMLTSAKLWGPWY